MKVFNAVCFCVLMDHHRMGVEEAHPEYIQEKLDDFLNRGESAAFSLLDHSNQTRVIDWCKRWNVDLPIIL